MEILPISCLVRNRQQTDADNESVLVDPLGNSLRAQSQCECVGEDGLLLRGNTFHDETNLHRVAFFFFLEPNVLCPCVFDVLERNCPNYDHVCQEPDFELPANVSCVTFS